VGGGGAGGAGRTRARRCGGAPWVAPVSPTAGRARKLLAEAGFAGGIDVTLLSGSGTMVNDKQLLEALADMWSKVGIRARVEMMEMAGRQKMVNERALPANGLRRIVHEDKPWLELFQDVVLYGVSKRVTLKPRADYRLLAAELTLAR
jgi:ABC-type transport system substrate-binding protein